MTSCCVKVKATVAEGRMAQWDFGANVDELVALSAAGRGPSSMAGMLTAAREVVARLRAEDPVALHEWLDANADFLIAQQVLAASVHAQQAAGDDVRLLLRDWLHDRAGGAADAGSGAAWLREEHPAILRAWLLSQVDRLVEDEITQLETQ
jgi:hypothetical protein